MHSHCRIKSGTDGTAGRVAVGDKKVWFATIFRVTTRWRCALLSAVPVVFASSSTGMCTNVMQPV